METLHSFFERQSDHSPEKICLIFNNIQISYKELEESANQYAHWLIARNVKTEDVIGVLVERSIDLYIIMLGIFKAGAVYLPIDPESPVERIKYISNNSNMALLLTSKEYAEKKLFNSDKTLEYEKIKPIITKQSKVRPKIANLSPDNLCYIIYTSGTTGHPKGVGITHRSVCNYVEAALKIYGITEKDRVYQGFTSSFDASLEEIWMAFAGGGTLVTGTSHAVREGGSLVDFLIFHKITVFSTVPTILAIIDPPIPSLKILILGGEKCPQTFIERWLRPNLRIFNTYGPTEATIITTFSECQAQKEITIGKPIPNCEVLILDEKLNPVETGMPGELFIGGAGLAREYINNPELTKEKFINYHNNPSRRIYRTGDIGRLTENGDIQYIGRTDEQIKVRGFRIELEEIENVLKRIPEIRDAVVVAQEFTPGMQTLVAYLILKEKFEPNEQAIQKIASDYLPTYMIPTLFEFVADFPKMLNGKIDKKALIKPILERIIVKSKSTALFPVIEKKITTIWENVLQISPIWNTANFFTELGGHSLAAANVISEMRRHQEMSNASLIDIFKYPTIQQLSRKMHDSSSKVTVDRLVEEDFNLKPKTVKEKLHYYFCAFVQALVSLILITISPWHFIIIVLIGVGFSLASSTLNLFQLAILWLLFLFLLEPALLLFGIVIKWLLLGKIKPGRHKIWGLYYLRWWLTNQVCDLAPIDHLVGSPFMNIYCRLMGAKIGKNCYLNTDQFCSFDLMSIGDNSSIGADVGATGYKVQHGWLHIGAITVGEDCYVGANSVLGINVKIGNGSKLGEHSLLSDGQIIPDGESYIGSPAYPGKVEIFQTPTETILRSKTKRFLHAICHYLLLMLLELVYVVSVAPGIILIVYIYYISGALINCIWAIPLAALLFISLMILQISLLKKIFRPVKKGCYSIHGYYYLKVWFIERLVALSLGTIEALYGTLFAAPWFRFLGAKIGKNSEISSVNFTPPDMLNIGEECFVGDNVMLATPQIYHGYINLNPIHLGNRVFIGNGATIPGGTKIGSNCLIACASIPPSNSVPSGTSWLGTPSLNLQIKPELTDSENLTYKPSLRAKVTRGAFEIFKIFLPGGFLYLILTLDVITFVTLKNIYSFLFALLIFPFFSVCYVFSEVLIIALLKWVLIGRCREISAPMWSTKVYCNEFVTALFDTVVVPFFLETLLGTPFVVGILRIFGVKIGKYSYIGTPYISEFDLVEIQDSVCLNRDCTIQTHLFEDRIFKTGPIVIEKGCSVGDRSILLYLTTMENYSSLGNLSLLMKGEVLFPFSFWEGIPAKRKYKSKSIDEV